MTAKTLGPIGVKAFENRGLSSETVVRFGVYTAKRNGSGEVAADPGGNIIVFPFEERGAVVNEKFRGPGKQFWQRTGGRRTFWNSDALDDPALSEGRMPLIITEGEIDALSAIECGFPLTVSVPDGAPPVPEGKAPEELEPEDPTAEAKGKFEFVYNNRERLRPIKRFVLAVDNDAPGKRLAAELVRRLSASRCMFVTYPEGCKDLNDVLVKHGPETVAAVLNGARPYPVHGLYRLSEFPELPPIATVSTGWWTLDQNLKPFLGELMFVLGIPGHGKSALIANLLVHWGERYGWRSAVFSPEEPPVPHLRDKLRRIRLRKVPFNLDCEEIAKADSWINDRFVFIAADPTNSDDPEAYLDWVIDRATDAVLRDGIRVLVIDPWNEVEHSRLPRESTTEYTGRAIRMLNKFRRQHDVMVIVLVHPTKEVGRDGKARAPTPYDTDGSAHFYNKADHFVIIHRPDEHLDESVIRVAKVKFEGTGERGNVRMHFDRNAGRFETLDAPASNQQPQYGVVA